MAKIYRLDVRLPGSNICTLSRLHVKGLTQGEEKTRRKSASKRYTGVKYILKGETPIVSTGTGNSFIVGVFGHFS